MDLRAGSIPILLGLLALGAGITALIAEGRAARRGRRSRRDATTVLSIVGLAVGVVILWFAAGQIAFSGTAARPHVIVITEAPG